MENITKTIMEVKVLTPQEGYYLTQSSLDENDERVFSEKIFLAKGAPESNWRLATQQEKDNYQSSVL